MKVRQINLNFGAKSIYPLKIKQKTQDGYKLVNAEFAELSLDSKIDAQCVEDLAENWRLTNYKNNYISDIRNSYKNDTLFWFPECKYFITRLMNKHKTMPDRVATIIAVKPIDKNRNLKIDFIQSAPKCPVFKHALQVKGAGEVTMMAIVKFAREHGFKKVKLVSTNDKFYEHLGLTHIIPLDPPKKPHDNITHFLPEYRYDSFIKRIEDKYHIN